jgi:chromosomal replication initiation ATPase DnaA
MNAPQTFDAIHHVDLVQRRPTVLEILRRTIAGTKYTELEIKGDSRMWELTRIRFAIYKGAMEHGYSSVQVGRALGGRDHTTILSGIHRIEEKKLMQDEDFRFFYNRARLQTQMELPL